MIILKYNQQLSLRICIALLLVFTLAFTSRVFLCLERKPSSHQGSYQETHLLERRSEQRETKLIHVSYVHFMDTTSDELSVENFKFFMNFGYSPCNPSVFYSIVLNRIAVNNVADSENDLLDLLGKYLFDRIKNCSISNGAQSRQQQLSHSDLTTRNTQVIFRDNKPGGDLCAHVDLLSSDFWTTNQHLFQLFVFINSSVRGPFLPSYYLKHW